MQINPETRQKIDFEYRLAKVINCIEKSGFTDITNQEGSNNIIAK